MKIIFINILFSLLYIPLLFIGQFIGNIFGSLISLIILNYDLFLDHILEIQNLYCQDPPENNY